MATSGKRPVEAIEAEAAAWAARLDAAPAQAQAGLDDWFSRDPGNAGALLRAQAALALFEPETGSREASAARRRPTRWRRRAFAGGTALTLAAACAALLIDPFTRTYATTTGEVRSLALDDGSSVAVDAQSRIAVDFTQHRRDVHLSSGKVLFRAAHLPARPFRVIVDDIVVTDVGTVFQVERDDRSGMVEVLVTEGAVRVDAPAGRLELRAGQRASFSQTRGGVRPQATSLKPAAVERQLSWLQGRLDLDGETLSYAVAEMNRHSGVRLRVGDPVLGAQRLFGSFRIDDADGFARAAALGLGTEVHTDSNGIIIGTEEKHRSD